MSEAFTIRTAVFQSGERLPVLLHQDTYQPVILCTRYILDERREIRQASTLLRDVRVLRWFYEWFEMAARDLEGDLRRGRLPTLSELTGFCHYLREKRIDRAFVPSTLVARPQQSVLGPQTFNSYLGVVQDFLMWAADELLPSVIPFQQAQVSLAAAKERILRAFRINRTTGRLPKKRYGLSDEEIKELRDVVNPASLRNPFRPGVRFRNCIITELMLATGVRRGELLKIKLSHLPVSPKTTLTVERCPDDKDDIRRNEPQVKTLEREIPIARELSRGLWRYVHEHRKEQRHPYLFVSQRGGVPLNAAAINRIFSLLVNRCVPHLRGRLHPHVLRHTFNDRLMDKAEQLGWSDDRRQKVQNYLNGWAEVSHMPEVYSRRSIEAQAMALAAKYQADLYRA